MLPKIDPTTTGAWQKLLALQGAAETVSLAKRFETDQNRFQQFLKSGGGLTIDFSKNHIDASIIKGLLNLARECRLPEAMKQFRNGEAINEREKRAVMHPALRSAQHEYRVNGASVQSAVQAELAHMRAFSEQVISGEWKGYTGKTITNIVNIGIGGSDLGPQMVCQALRPFGNGLKTHFLSNVDANNWEEIRLQLDPERTLFIIVSKTFTTDETITNAQTVRQWMLDQGAPAQAISTHFVAVSTNLEQVEAFGIDKTNVFGFWDWVGGRFSLWSAVGLSICLSVGYQRFIELLNGAQAMDMHFFEAPLEENLPVWMALIGIWYRNFWNMGSHAVLPYNHLLLDFPRFLQQLIMESNGKQVDRHGKKIQYPTSPIYWGEPGTNGQHAFHQLLHQGTDVVPCDFILVQQSEHNHQLHDDKLIANGFAQSEALMMGRKNDADPFRNFEGNRPSTTILIKDLSPHSLGSLIACYEHQVFVQGIIWNIYSFDQWGVELGKTLARSIQSGEQSNHTSTQHLLNLTQR